MGSWYKSFAELSAVEKDGLAFRLKVKNRKTEVAIIAPHGGGIEPGTSEIATAIAGLNYSLYTFDGIRLSGNELLHITSTLFDEPRCLRLIQSSETVIAIHGCSGAKEVVYLGGLNLNLGDQIINELEKSGFEATRATTRFRGDQIENICNRGRAGRKEVKPAFRNFVITVRHVLLSENMTKL